MPLKYIPGDLIKLALAGQFDVIVHGCNCFCTMGSGVAGAIARAPEFAPAVLADRQTMKGDYLKLGTYTYAVCPPNVTVINAYTQYDYGSSGRHVEYLAVKNCLERVAKNFMGNNGPWRLNRIGIPKIGAGLGGGDWAIIEDIIKREMHFCDVTVVVL